MITSLMNLVLLAGANPTWQSFDKLANSELGHMTKVVRNSNRTQHRKKPNNRTQPNIVNLIFSLIQAAKLTLDLDKQKLLMIL